MQESQAVKTKYFKKSVKANLIIGFCFYLLIVINVFILKNILAVTIAFLVLGTYRIIIAGINYLSLKKSKKNFLEKRSVEINTHGNEAEFIQPKQKHMKKTEELNQLFIDWQNQFQHYKGKFVSDGIMNEEIYLNAKPKLLFIAKEANNPSQTEGDFRDYWKDGAKETFSYRIAEWSYGIQNNFPPFDSIYNSDDSVYKTALNSIAFMNVKKAAGGGLSEFEEVLSAVKSDKFFLLKEIEIINPDIVILGLSVQEIRDNLFDNLKWVRSGYEIEIAKSENRKFIDFYHPSARNAPSAAYSLLQNVINSDSFKNL